MGHTLQGWGLTWVGISLLTGCGGRAATDEGTSVQSGGSAADGGDASSVGGSPTAGSGAAGSGGAIEDPPSGGATSSAGGTPPDPTPPAWESEFGTSGYERSSISFLEDGGVELSLWFGPPQNEAAYAFDAQGEEREPDDVHLYQVHAVDPSGRYRVTSSEGGCFLYEDGQPTEKVGSGCTGGYGFANDGSFVSQVSCYETTTVRVYDTSQDNLIEAELTTDLPCPEARPLVVTDVARGRTLFAIDQRPQIFVFDWATETLRLVAVHDGSEPPKKTYAGTVINMSLSHHGDWLVTVGSNDGGALLDAESYEVEQRLPDVSYFNISDSCGCIPTSLSVLAWSPDDRFYLTTPALGALDVRDARTHALVMRLRPPVPSIPQESSTDYGPLLARFSPDGERVVALYPGVFASWELELSEE